MLAHVGLCWGHVGLRWPQVGSKMAQDRFMLAQVGPKMPKKAPKASQVPQDEVKMAPRWLPNRYVLGSRCFFRSLLPDLCFPTFFLLFGSWEHQFSQMLGTKANEFSIILGILGRVRPKKPQDCCRMAYLSLSGPNMEPSWLQVDSS